MDERFDNLVRQRFETREAFQPSDVRGSSTGYNVVPPPPPMEAEAPAAPEENTVMDAIGDVFKGVGSGLVAGVSKAGQEIGDTLTGGFYSSTVMPWLRENVPGLSEANEALAEATQLEGTTQEVSAMIAEPLAQIVAPGALAARTFKAAGIGSRYLSEALGYGAAEVAAVAPKDQTLLEMGIQLIDESSDIRAMLDAGLGAQEDENAFIERLKNAPRRFLEGGPLGLVAERAIEGIGMAYRAIRNSPKYQESVQRFKDGKSPMPMGLSIEDVSPVDTGRLTDTKPINDNEYPSLREVLIKKSEEMQVKPDKRTQPTDDQMFDVSPVSYEQGIVSEMQIETPVPRAPAGAKLPKKGRTQGIVDNLEEIADRIAERAKPGVGTNVQYFYHIGPLIRKAEDLGIPEDKARNAIKEFSLLYGATSPRTQTEPNLRSASLVRAKDKQNINYDEIVGPGGTGINEVGFPMMINKAKKGQAAGIHKLLIDQLRNTGKIDYRTNPKPATFAENVGGNLNGVTVDTHAIRGALYTLNQIMPGAIPRQWFNNETAYKAYLDDPSDIQNYSGAGIADTLDGQVVDGLKQQTEYAIFSDLYKMVADRLGVQPAEAQSLSWFANGEFTGLASPPKTIVELINERVDVTAQALNRSKDAIFKGFIEGKIPLMSFGGALVGVNMLEQDNGN